MYYSEPCDYLYCAWHVQKVPLSCSYSMCYDSLLLAIDTDKKLSDCHSLSQCDTVPP
jgi:hypothetical protein